MSPSRMTRAISLKDPLAVKREATAAAKAEQLRTIALPRTGERVFPLSNVRIPPARLRAHLPKKRKAEPQGDALC